MEHGGGAVVLRRAVLVLVALTLSLVFPWKQFRGLTDEWTMQQADTARQVARGQGFTTLVNYPQTYAVLRTKGVPFDEAKPYPELYHAPLYPLTLAAVFAVLPSSIWQHVPSGMGGWGPDYVVLAVNVLLLWVAVWLAWRLARRLFDGRVAFLAASGLVLSVSLWERTVMACGLPLLMVLTLACCLLVAGLEERLATEEDEGCVWRWWQVAMLSALGTGIFLTEYSAGLVWLVFGGWLAWRAGRSRGRWLAVYVGVALLLTLPWFVRNMTLVGNPLGLAWQNLALKADDPTALPVTWRTSITTEAPGVEIPKVANKGLTGLEKNLQERVWSGGALIFAAFFLAGLAYRFRHGPVNRLRWLVVALVSVLLGGQSFFGSGESLRWAAVWLAPLLVVFGAGFFFVLVDSQPALARHWRWAAAGVLLWQGLPLVRDCLEPRRVHFTYPPYYPALFGDLARESRVRFLPGAGLAADIPAGAAWYGQMRVWAKPQQLRDFYEIGVRQPIAALLLSSVTLDKPFFTELAARRERTITLSDPGGWGVIYAGLVSREMPVNFPLRVPQRLTENMILLCDPTAYQLRKN